MEITTWPEACALAVVALAGAAVFIAIVVCESRNK